MTPEERQDFEQLKHEFAQLKELFYKGDFPTSKVFEKDVESTTILKSSGEGIRLSHRDYPDGAHIHTGNEINSAGIISEVGHTCPNGSLYLSSSATQPFLVMVGTSWVLVNLP